MFVLTDAINAAGLNFMKLRLALFVHWQAQTYE